MPLVRFKAELVRRRQQLCLDLPPEASDALGHKGRVPVTGTLNTFPIKTSVFPTDDGGHFMMVPPDLQRLAGVSVGSNVKVVLQVARQPAKVEVPEDLQRALDGSEQAKKAFERLAFSHQREYVEWIEEAKRPETRARRIEKTVERLLETPAV